MVRLNQLLDLWYIKLAFGGLLTLFAPVQTSIIITFIMIGLDTLTGMAFALKIKRFSSKGIKKLLKKVALYSVCILTVRLIEVGALASMRTMMLTQITAGFLIITEGISIIENLSMLGLPIPKSYINTVFKQLKIGILEEIVKESQKGKEELKDIEEVLYYQVPSIKCEWARKLLNVMIESWIHTSKEIITYFEGVQSYDNDLIYYKVMGMINIGIREKDEWIKELTTPNECMNYLIKYDNERVQTLQKDIKRICYKILEPEKKKEELIKRITILVYQTILDSQKCESGLCELPRE